MTTPTARYLMVAYTAARPGRDDEYSDWAENVHMPEVRDLPGVVSARRYEAWPGPSADENRFLVLYEIETDDVASVLAEFRRRSAEVWSPPSEAGDPSRTAVRVFLRRV